MALSAISRIWLVVIVCIGVGFGCISLYMLRAQYGTPDNTKMQELQATLQTALASLDRVSAEKEELSKNLLESMKKTLNLEIALKQLEPKIENRTILLSNDSYLSVYTTGKRLKEDGEIVVLLYDHPGWTGWAQGDELIPPNYGGYRHVKKKCNIPCTFTRQRSLASVADVVIYQPVHHHIDWWNSHAPILFPEKYPGQQWWSVTYENPVYFRIQTDPRYTAQLDGGIGFDRRSEVQITLTCPFLNNSREAFLAPVPEKKPGHLVVWIASNCGRADAKKRMEFVRELMEYIDVHSYGICLHNKDFPEAHHPSIDRRLNHGDMMQYRMKIVRDYKFVLAFENADVDDYVTEKLPNSLLSGTVPVYWGTDLVDDWTPGNHSIIKAKDFGSAKELAKYLKYLDRHDEEYMQYFAWKQHGLAPQFVDKLDKCVFDAECRICQRALELKRTRGLGRPPFEAHAYALLIGSLGYVEIPYHPSLALTDQYTLMAWVNPTYFEDGRVIDRGTAGTINGFNFDLIQEPDAGNARGWPRLCAADGCFEASLRIDGERGPMTAGVWYHVCVSFIKGGTSRFYINGELAGSFHTNAATVDLKNAPLRFGRPARFSSQQSDPHWTTEGQFEGMIDNIAIFNVALSQEQVFKFIFGQPTGTEPGLVGFWSFDEEHDARIVYDRSPYGNHGNIIGDVKRVPLQGKALQAFIVKTDELRLAEEEKR